MRRNWFTKILMFLVFAPLFVIIFGFVVMRLWNWLAPGLFGWHLITFWQAIGILVLSRILFGGIHGRGSRGGHWRGRMGERWAKMTPEEREKFRQSMRGRCESFDTSSSAPSAESKA